MRHEEAEELTFLSLWLWTMIPHAVVLFRSSAKVGGRPIRKLWRVSQWLKLKLNLYVRSRI